jgi:hypothetical protein
VSIGSATTNTPASKYDTDMHTVSWHLANATTPPADENYVSQAWLRVYMTFNPDMGGGNPSPGLRRWAQTYDCVPCE